MAEQLERKYSDEAAHILADLHVIRRTLADALGVIATIDQRQQDIAREQLEHGRTVAELAELLAELGPVARRAAAMFTSPVGRWAAPGNGEPRPPRRERKGRRNRGDDDRTE